MTCVLSMPSLYSFDDGSDLPNTSQDLEFNWIHDLAQQSGGFGINYVHDNVRYSTPCRADGSSLPKNCDRRDSLDAVAQSTVVNDESEVWCKETVQHKGARTRISETKEGMSICKTMTHQFTDKLLNVSNHDSPQGNKRKAEETECTNVPVKRISPFLNTPKGRKDERKTILKLSIKKLKQVEDPELCLRRTVLINNTMKRLQAEVREEQYHSKTFGTYTSRHKPFCKYGRLENKCLSNSYLFDDPFLSGVHEKITDDMTEMLVNNVLNDKTSDATIGYDKKDNSENSSDKLPCNERRPDRSGERCIQGNSISQDACKTQILQDACNEDGVNKFSETFCEPMDIGNSIGSNNFENSKFSESWPVGIKNTLDSVRPNPVKNIYNGNVIGGALHTSNPTETNIDRQTHNGCSLENLKHLLSDIEFGNESSCDINVRYVSKTLDKKPISNSFNTFSMSSDSSLSWYMSPTTC